MPRSRTSAAATTSSARVADVAPPTVDRLWTIGEVSAFLGIPIATLHQWRYLGTGPDAYRVGKHLRYSPVAVQAWLESECRREVSA
jgi:hypothetical protein